MPYRVLTEYLIMSVGVVVVCLCAVPWVHNVTLAHAHVSCCFQSCWWWRIIVLEVLWSIQILFTHD